MQVVRYNPRRMKFDISVLDEGGCKIAFGNKHIIINQPYTRLMYSWYQWQMQGKFVQDAFHYLSADEREFIMTGITAGEWKLMFPEE